MRFRLGKRVISQYIRSECLRRLRLDLIADADARRAEKAPPKDSARPGLQLLTRQGREYERKKFAELLGIFDSAVIHGPITPSALGESSAFGRISLADHIGSLLPDRFLIEAEYEITKTFIHAHALDELANDMSVSLAFDRARPDILQVIEATGQERKAILADGTINKLIPEDSRKGIRIIDIKIAGEPSPAHFSELAYYGMTLAAWLTEKQLDDRYFVLADAAIWPGKHEASALAKQEMDDDRNRVGNRDRAKYLFALETDLVTMPPEVVVGRVRRFLSHDLREAITPQNWKQLPWHVDSGCSGCDYLGYRWTEDTDLDPREPVEVESSEGDNIDIKALYCWPTAAREKHLSRVPGLTEGASAKLREASVETVDHLAALKPGARAFEGHQVLKARRTVFSARAIVLQESVETRVPDRAGTSAIMPRFPDIKVAVTVDFDVGSGITFAFGYHIDYAVPLELEGKTPKKDFRHKVRVLVVESGSIGAEGQILEEWLGHLTDDILRAGSEVDAGFDRIGWSQRASIQFYLWDKLTFDHLRRVMSRHMENILTPAKINGTNIDLTAWLFPAEQVLEDPNFVSQTSPVTIVGEAVDSILASPVPHRHTMISIANSINPDRKTLDGRPWGFWVNKFYQDPLSDQIPSERGQEIWNNEAPFARMDHQEHRDKVKSVISVKLRAILYVTEFLAEKLGTTLLAEAPSVASIFKSYDRLPKAADDSQIIYEHSRLMSAAQRLDVALTMAMPPHEREARFMSVRVTEILTGDIRRTALESAGLASKVGDSHVLALKISPRSRDAKIKEGDFQWSMLPENEIARLQNLTVWQFKSANPAILPALPLEDYERHKPLRQGLAVQILKIQRSSLILIVETAPLLFEAIRTNAVRFDLDPDAAKFAILDIFYVDYFTKYRLKPALSEIANPSVARTRPLFPTATITKIARARRPRMYPRVPPDPFIWEADIMAQAPGKFIPEEVKLGAQEELAQATAAQLDAIEAAATKRLALWWGPPGSGKSATAVALLRGLIESARKSGTGLRIAVVGPTWVAIDNIASKLPQILGTDVQLARLISGFSMAGSVLPVLQPFVLPANDDAGMKALDMRLCDPHKRTIVASTVEQLWKLGEDGLKPLFDFMLIDEASQMDVAHAIVAFTKLAPDASLTVVGDDKQMQPIHPLEAPAGVEHLLGSIYNFYRQYGTGSQVRSSVTPIMLNTSFRSNSEIIAFVREAGYGPSFVASPKNAGVRIGLQPAPDSCPADWPSQLPWSPELEALLDPEQPLVALIHPDRYSSQRNEAEADVVAAMVLALYQRGLMDLETANSQPYSDQDFFRRGVGIVTPHRAQQAAVLDRLDAYLPPSLDRDALYSAVDTVERFQGQEKAVMIASFGLGDADQIGAEETFLFSLNRFNVIVSRAKAKFIGVLSRRLVDHLPKDPTALQESRLLKYFADGFLTQTRLISLPGLKQCEIKTK